MLNYNSTNFKLNRVIFGLLGLVVLVILNNLFSTFINDDSKFLKQEIKSIKSKIENYKEQNEKLNQKLADYEKILVKIDTNISINNKKIDKLKLETNEKINSFKSYDSGMWEKFFADRYKK